MEERPSSRALCRDLVDPVGQGGGKKAGGVDTRSQLSLAMERASQT